MVISRAPSARASRGGRSRAATSFACGAGTLWRGFAAGLRMTLWRTGGGAGGASTLNRLELSNHQPIRCKHSSGYANSGCRWCQPAVDASQAPAATPPCRRCFQKRRAQAIFSFGNSSPHSDAPESYRQRLVFPLSTDFFQKPNPTVKYPGWRCASLSFCDLCVLCG